VSLFFCRQFMIFMLRCDAENPGEKNVSFIALLCPLVLDLVLADLTVFSCVLLVFYELGD
jgi:hypothetical protein